MLSTGYREIAAQLQSIIESGELGPGAPVPSEADLARRHGVTRTTARRALVQLEEQGLISAAPGGERFVRSLGQSGKQAHSKFERVAEDLREEIENGRYRPAQR